jgi:hypothetical protein
MGFGAVVIARARIAYRPLAGCPLMATISPKPVATKKWWELRTAAGVVRAGFVPYCDTSEVSARYSTKFSKSIVRIAGCGACPRARRQVPMMMNRNVVFWSLIHFTMPGIG